MPEVVVQIHMYREYGHMGDQLVLANSDIENSICMRLGISDSQLTVFGKLY